MSDDYGDGFDRPALSPVQRSYRQEPSTFLASVHARAESLFARGYRAKAARLPGLFQVLPENPKRAERNGSPEGYLVHAVKGTCSCPFFAKQEQGEWLEEDGSLVACKHLIGLEKLVRETAADCRSVGDLHGFYRLAAQWMEVLAERYREGIGNTAPPAIGYIAAGTDHIEKGKG